MALPDTAFDALRAFLASVPAVDINDAPSRGIGTGSTDDIWWVKFGIRVEHPLAWRVVQELAHVLNYLSIDEPLPTLFKPVSPPPYMNGGPEDFLSWVIECPVDAMSPHVVTQWLEGRLPRPVDDLAEWELS